MKLEIVNTEPVLPDAEIIAHYQDLTDDEWVELRKGGIGGSDAGAIMGLSQYASPLTVWMEKTGRAAGFEGNEATEVGSQLEPLIRDHMLLPYMEKEGIPGHPTEAPYVWQSKTLPWMRANMDGLIVTDDDVFGLEIKTGNSYTLTNWADGETPPAYWAQCQHYMAVTGLRVFLLFGLIGNRRMHRVIERNQPWIDELIETEKALWDLVELDDPAQSPVPMGLDCEDAALGIIGRPVDETEVHLDDIDDVLSDYVYISQQIKELTQAKKAAQQTIKHAMGTASSGSSSNYTVSRTTYKKPQFEHGRFKADHPELVADYMKETTIDFPRVKELK